MTRHFVQLNGSDMAEIRLPGGRTVVLNTHGEVTVTYAPNPAEPFVVGYAHLYLPVPEAGMDDHGLQEYDVERNFSADTEDEEDA